MTTHVLPVPLSDQQLVAIVRTGRARDGVSVLGAMAALRSRPMDGKRELFGAVIVDATRPPRLRHMAAVGLYELGPGVGEEALVDAADRVDPATAVTVATGLARIGSADALATIGRLATIAEPAPERIAFARSLLAYRHRLDGHEIEFPADRLLDLPPGEPSSVVDIRAAGEEARRALSAVEREPIGVALDAENAIHIVCGDTHHVFAWNARRAAGDLDDLDERKDLLGVVFRKSPIEDTYALAAFVLATPAGPSTARITVHRAASGEPVFAGTIELTNGLPGFRFQAVRRPGAASVAVQGRVRGADLDMERADSARRALAGREPRRSPE
jgi:hypothetical protein